MEVVKNAFLKRRKVQLWHSRNFDSIKSQKSCQLAILIDTVDLLEHNSISCSGALNRLRMFAVCSEASIFHPACVRHLQFINSQILQSYSCTPRFGPPNVP